MSKPSSKTFLSAVAGLALGFTLSLAVTRIRGPGPGAGQAPPPEALHGRPARGKSLEGFWFVRVTLRDCQTGDVVGAFRAMSAFARDGALAEINAGGDAARHVHGLGTWRHLGGRHHAAVHRSFLFDPDGRFAGTQRIARDVELGEGGDAFNATAAVEIFDADDRIVRTECATETATRLE
ncbi:MAG: hypothetical protein ACRD68_15080 [Pyrinomonadaceae bacterium]